MPGLSCQNAMLAECVCCEQSWDYLEENTKYNGHFIKAKWESGTSHNNNTDNNCRETPALTTTSSRNTLTVSMRPSSPSSPCRPADNKQEKPIKTDFLVSFLVDARGGAMTGGRSLSNLILSFTRFEGLLVPL